MAVEKCILLSNVPSDASNLLWLASNASTHQWLFVGECWSSSRWIFTPSNQLARETKHESTHHSKSRCIFAPPESLLAKFWRNTRMKFKRHCFVFANYRILAVGPREPYNTWEYSSENTIYPRWQAGAASLGAQGERTQGRPGDTTRPTHRPPSCLRRWLLK